MKEVEYYTVDGWFGDSGEGFVFKEIASFEDKDAATKFSKGRGNKGKDASVTHHKIKIYNTTDEAETEFSKQKKSDKALVDELLKEFE